MGAPAEGGGPSKSLISLGPSDGAVPCFGSGRAGKRQSQSLLKPKLEFRGPKLARFPAFFDQKRPKLGVAP